MVMGAPLEDARHLAQRYDRMRQEAEAQMNLYSQIRELFLESIATVSQDSGAK